MKAASAVQSSLHARGRNVDTAASRKQTLWLTVTRVVSPQTTDLKVTLLLTLKSSNGGRSAFFLCASHSPLSLGRRFMC